jgi:phenylacetate-CoA ligase
LNPYRLLYDVAQWVRGEPVGAVLRELREGRRGTPETLHDLHWQRRRQLLIHAWSTVPWYRQRLQELRIDPHQVRSPEAWNELPVVEKQEFQARATEFMSARAPRGFAASTSGSSGTPVTVLRSHSSWANGHANMIDHMAWNGVEWGERHAYFWGVPLDGRARRQATLRDALFNRDRCSAFALDAGLARSFYERQLKRPSHYALGYPSALTKFADELEAQRLDGRALGWKTVITTAEVLHDHQRKRIERALGCHVSDSYGCAEVGPVGLECAKGRLHVPIESVAVDFLTRDEGHTELLLTDLHNFSQPMIRYRVGDLLRVAGPADDSGNRGAAPGRAGASLLPTSACACGLPLPVLPPVLGRAGDTLELPDGRRVNANLPSYIFKHHGKADTIREYQFVQFPGGRIALRITLGPNWQEATRAELLGQVREVLGITAELEIVPRIERRGRGKHRDFIRAETEEA